MKKHLLTGLFLTLFSSVGLAKDSFDALAEKTWTTFGYTKNACPKYFDYFPQGGMRSVYCHAKYFLDYKTLQDWVGEPVFVKGPHTKNTLMLEAPNYFGYYNPQFVTKLQHKLIPTSPQAIAVTKPMYHKYVESLARIHYLTHQKWQKHPEELKREMLSYQSKVERDELPTYYYEKFFYFLNPEFFAYQDNPNYLMNHGFDGGYSGNVVKTAAAFWVRRHLDGTADEFFTALTQLLNTYDKAFISLQENPPHEAH